MNDERTHGFDSAIDDEIAMTPNPPAASDPAPESAIPTGMKPWAGGEEAPADWDEEAPVLFRDGSQDQDSYWYWPHDGDANDIIAYTPRPAPDVELDK